MLVHVSRPPIGYQQQYDFLTFEKVGDGSVRFVHLGQQAADGRMAKVLEAIVQEIESSSPAIVVVDSEWEREDRQGGEE